MGHVIGEVAFSAMVKIVDLYCEGNHWRAERKEMTWRDLYFQKIIAAAVDQRGSREQEER